MLDLSLYPMIYKRKSFHLFRNLPQASISDSEIREIYAAYERFEPLMPGIRTAIRIVPAEETSCARGQEYCILLYSEKTENYLANIGYLGQQLDLYLVSKNIGTLWFGIGKVTENTYMGLDYVIMIAIRKVPDDSKFRKDMFKSKRKPLEQIWHGEPIVGVSDIVRFSPSACNTQPWLVVRSGTHLSVYRYKMPEKCGIMPAKAVSYYNCIDIGIFIYFLNICLENERISYNIQLHVDPCEDAERTLVAEYTLDLGGET